MQTSLTDTRVRMRQIEDNLRRAEKRVNRAWERLVIRIRQERQTGTHKGTCDRFHPSRAKHNDIAY